MGLPRPDANGEDVRQRKAYKTVGMIEFFSGRLFHHRIGGKFKSPSYQAFLLSVLAQTTEHLFLIQDGAKYHASKATFE